MTLDDLNNSCIKYISCLLFKTASIENMTPYSYLRKIMRLAKFVK